MLWPTSTLASPLECALAKNAPATPLEYALAKSLDLKSPEINTYKKGWGILAGRDAGATKSFPPPFHLLPLTVCLLPPRDSTELTTAVSPTRLSFRGPTFSVGRRNLSERSLTRRVRLGMTGQKKIALRWQAAAFMRSALALGDTNSWKTSSTRVMAGGLLVNDAVLHHMHEVAQRLHRAQRVAIHHNDVRGLPGSNRAQVVALQQLRRPESGRADGVHGVHSQTDKGVQFPPSGVEVEVHGDAGVGSGDQRDAGGAQLGELIRQGGHAAADELEVRRPFGVIERAPHVFVDIGREIGFQALVMESCGELVHRVWVEIQPFDRGTPVECGIALAQHGQDIVGIAGLGSQPGVLKAVCPGADSLADFLRAVGMQDSVLAGGMRRLDDGFQLLEGHLVLVNHLDQVHSGVDQPFGLGASVYGAADRPAEVCFQRRHRSEEHTSE